MATSCDAGQQPAPSIEARGLSYRFADGTTGLKDITLDLPPRCRALLIGGMEQLPIPPTAKLTNEIVRSS